MDKRVAIVGFASSSRDMAPYTDESYEIWGLNHAYSFIPRWTRWFQIHPYSHFTMELHGMDGKNHLEWLTSEPEGKRPIYTQEHFAEIPASVRFPREEINAWFASQDNGDGTRVPLPLGYHAADYYTSTPAEMLALAIYEGFTEIAMYGIDMLQSEEYFYQRSGCEYYVAFARGRGIKVYIPQQSALCKANYVYGYSEPPTDIDKMQEYVTYLRNKVAESDANKGNALAAAQTMDGGLQMARLILAVLDKTTDPALVMDAVKAECNRHIELLTGKHAEAIRTVAAMDGQRAGFECSATWAEHWARGGKLEK